MHDEDETRWYHMLHPPPSQFLIPSQVSGSTPATVGCPGWWPGVRPKGSGMSITDPKRRNLQWKVEE